MPVVYDNAELQDGASVIMYVSHSDAVTVFCNAVSYLPAVYMRPFLASYHNFNGYRYFADYTYEHSSNYELGTIEIVSIAHYYFLTQKDADFFYAGGIPDGVNCTSTVVNKQPILEEKSVDYRPIVNFHWAVLN